MSKISFQQIPLISAICTELSRQHPGLAVNTRQYNALIKAANQIIVAMEQQSVPATPGMGIDAWFNCDDVGTSSLFMASVLSHREVPKYGHPHDADDFGRCVMLLLAAPELADSFPELAIQSPEWRVIVENWNEWVTCFGSDGFYEVLQGAYQAARLQGAN